MSGDLSWVPVYEAIQAGTYGDPDSYSARQMVDRLFSEAKNHDELVSKGAIILSTGSGDSFSAGTVDWSKLPRYGPEGDTPKNTFYAPVNSQYRVDPYTQQPIGADKGFGAIYHDENFGDLQLIQDRAPDDPIMSIGRSVVLGLVTGGAASGLAALIAPTLGISSGFGVNALSAMFRALPGIAMGGDPIKGLVGAAASASGLPGASAVASTTYDLVKQKPKP